MEVVGVVSYGFDNDKILIPPSVFSKITSRVAQWIKAVTSTVKDSSGCDINEVDIGIKLKWVAFRWGHTK